MKLVLKFKQVEQLFFGIAILLCLIPIWFSGQFFITGDGPSHSYNASVLLDWLNGKHLDYYRQFYSLNNYFEPNYWTHAWLTLLQMVCTPELAEKIFLSAYVLAFGFGIRFLFRQINPAGLFLSSVGMLFCWHHLLQMGFFNYAWSIAGFFWITGYWLYIRGVFNYRIGAAMAFGWIVLYSMHPVGLAFAALAIGLSMIGEFIADFSLSGFKSAAEKLLSSSLFLAITAIPALVLTGHYLMRKEWHQGANQESFRGILDAWATLTMLITMNKEEHGIVNAVVMLVVVLVVSAVLIRIKTPKWQVHDFWLLFFLVALLIYFMQYGSRSWELLMPLRLQLFSWLAILIWSAGTIFSIKWRLIVASAAIILLSVLLASRLPAHRAASELVEEWTSVKTHIDPQSVLMVMNYNFNGTDQQGNIIGDRIWLFNHAADYIGASVPGVIMSDNYEASLRYFPLIWQNGVNLYTQTEKDGIGFENRPPRVDLLSYPKRTNGKQINYVLVLDQTEDDRQHPYGQEFMLQLNAGYTQIAASPHERAVLYKLKEKQ
ncbi:MAG: hypothetical protein KDC86_04920 [Saprospiraceae bacterium]|nr:hypothetical protein [Saprospiraceae bacterium]